MYTAIVLTPSSALAALNMLDWTSSPALELLGHHVTVNMGAHASGPAADIPIGTTFRMVTTHVGIFAGKVFALRVQGVTRLIPTVNDLAHVTLAVNRDKGGKPRMSNDIAASDWMPCVPVELCGALQEC